MAKDHCADKYEHRWIGNAAEDGICATVFARLKVPAPDGSGALDDQVSPMLGHTEVRQPGHAGCNTH